MQPIGSSAVAPTYVGDSAAQRPLDSEITHTLLLAPYFVLMYGGTHSVTTGAIDAALRR
jgi:hypothetical protein